MDDDFDILALAIESVEQEEVHASINNTPLSKSPFALKNSNDKKCSPGLDKDRSQEESPKSSKGRSLVGVDLCFEETEPVDNKEKILAEPKQKNLFLEKSVVHTGDTDSSDDEGNKYFEDVKYDSFGKFVKNKLKSSGNHSLTSFKDSSWKKNKTDTHKPPTPARVPSRETKVDVSADPIFGIRIINPLISSQIIKEKMIGRTPIGFAKIKYHVSYGDLNNDWVIAAVIVKKLPPRVSQNGNNYSSWIISDLKSDLKTVFLFLFGKAHHELWKTPAGTVLAILNPSVLKNDNDKKSEYEAKLSIKSADQVMIWGKSKDLGQCKVIKKNGEMCGAFVNSYLCEVCVYHVKQEYNKCNNKAGRPEFSSSGNLNLRNKVLGKNEVFYAGKSFTAVAPPSRSNKKNISQDVSRLKGLGTTIAKVPEIVSIPNLQRSNEILKLLPSVKNPLNRTSDKSRLDLLSTSHSNKESIIKDVGLSSSEKYLKTGELEMKNNSNKTFTARNIDSKSNLPVLKVPTLSNPEKEFSLNVNRNSNETKSVISPLTVKSDEKLVRSGKKSKANLQKRFNNLVGMQCETKEENNHRSLNNSKIAGNNEKRVAVQSNKNSSLAGPNVLKDSSNAGVPSTPRRIALNSNSTMKSPTVNDENIDSRDKLADQTLTNDIPILQTESPKASLYAGSQNNFTTSTPNSKISRAKMKALLYVKSNGPISKENASKVKNEGKSCGVKRPYPSEDDEENTKTVLSERFIELMNQKSLHEDLIELREYEQEMEYFDKMEKKDRLEEKMLNTYKVDCKAVKCLKCNYLWFSASDACKAEGHPLKVIDTVKRFFKCGNCENRTVSLTVIPLLPCKKCSGSNWVRTAMMKEKIAKNDTLSIRGGEQKFVNSVITNASLNLLVPD